MGWFHSIIHHAEDAGKSVGRGIKNEGDAAGSAVKKGAYSAANTAREVGEAAGNLNNILQSNGITVGPEFLEGAKLAGKLAEEGMADTGRGLLAMGKYPTSAAADMAVGGPLAAALANALKPSNDGGKPPVKPDIQAEVRSLAKKISEDILQKVPFSKDLFKSVEICTNYIVCIVNKGGKEADFVDPSKRDEVKGYLIVLLTDVIIDGKIVNGCTIG